MKRAIVAVVMIVALAMMPIAAFATPVYRGVGHCALGGATCFGASVGQAMKAAFPCITGEHTQIGCPLCDVDGNGICDRFEHVARSQAQDQGQNPYAAGCGTGSGCGYVDVNDDGICDNYGTSLCPHQGPAQDSIASTGAGQGHRRGGHHGGGRHCW